MKKNTTKLYGVVALAALLPSVAIGQTAVLDSMDNVVAPDVATIDGDLLMNGTLNIAPDTALTTDYALNDDGMGEEPAIDPNITPTVDPVADTTPVYTILGGVEITEEQQTSGTGVIAEESGDLTLIASSTDTTTKGYIRAVRTDIYNLGHPNEGEAAPDSVYVAGFMNDNGTPMDTSDDFFEEIGELVIGSDAQFGGKYTGTPLETELVLNAVDEAALMGETVTAAGSGGDLQVGGNANVDGVLSLGDSGLGAVPDVASTIWTNLNNISDNASDIAVNSSTLVVHAGLVSDNASDIDVNEAGIAANSSTLVVHAGLVSDNASNIAVNSAGVAANSSTLVVHAGLVSDNASNIAVNSSTLVVHAGLVSDNASNIAVNAADNTVQSLLISANIDNITMNTSDIATNSSTLVVHEGLVLGNASDIDVNEAAIAANSSTLVVHEGLVLGNASDIDVNEAAIAANASTLVVHEGLVLGNASDIDVNEAAIAANASTLVVHEGLVLGNVSAIADIQTNGIAGIIEKKSDGIHIGEDSLVTNLNEDSGMQDIWALNDGANTGINFKSDVNVESVFTVRAASEVSDPVVNDVEDPQEAPNIDRDGGIGSPDNVDAVYTTISDVDVTIESFDDTGVAAYANGDLILYSGGGSTDVTSYKTAVRLDFWDPNGDDPGAAVQEVEVGGYLDGDGNFVELGLLNDDGLLDLDSLTAEQLAMITVAGPEDAGDGGNLVVEGNARIDGALTLGTIADVEQSILDEVTAREAGDAALAGAISAEELARATADDVLDGKITEVAGNLADEAAARAAADDALTAAYMAADSAIVSGYMAADAALSAGIDAVNMRVNHLESKVDSNTRGIAMAAALTSPTVREGMENALDFSLAHFDGETGAAIAYARRVNENVQINIAAAADTDFEETIVRGGVSLQW